MSASPVFSSAARGRPFLLPSTKESLLERLDSLRKLPARVTPASCLEVRPAPAIISSGISELDALTGGVPRGCLTEICGPASSGRTSILLAAMASITRHGEVCALVDASDALDPASAAAAGVEMSHLLWVRCNSKNSPRRRAFSYERQATSGEHTDRSQRIAQSQKLEAHILDVNHSPAESSLEQVLKVTDLLLQSNGFGMIVLDLSDIPVRSARRIPLVSWFRFRRAVEHTPTVLLVIEQQPIAGSCSSMLLQVAGKKPTAVSHQSSSNSVAHTQLLDEIEVEVELLRSRLQRKPARSAVTSFCSRAVWAG